MIVEVTEYVSVHDVHVIEEITQIYCEYSDLGAQGLSAYQIAQANGYPGTEKEWVDEILAKSWWDLILGKISTGDPVTIATGIVKPFVFETKSGSTVTLYRFKATDKSVDGFYSGFSGTSLTGLVAQKKVKL